MSTVSLSNMSPKNARKRLRSDEDASIQSEAQAQERYQEILARLDSLAYERMEAELEAEAMAQKLEDDKAKEDGRKEEMSLSDKVLRRLDRDHARWKKAWKDDAWHRRARRVRARFEAGLCYADGTSVYNPDPAVAGCTTMYLE